MTTLILNQLTLEQAKNHNQRNYNPIEWEKGILRMISWFGDVKFYEHKDKVYAIYNAKGIRSIKEMDYMSSIDNAGLKSFTLNGSELVEYSIKISKKTEDLNFAKELTKISPTIVFASVYFNI